MKDYCIISDFDGTITKTDSLFNFFETYADKKWLEVEKEWTEGKISSKECLIREFELVKNLSPALINSYLDNIEIDVSFLDFYKKIQEKNIDFFIASDGIDYFIKKLLEKSGLPNINVVSNHGEFVREKFVLTFPNSNPKCKNSAGTCKCAIVEEKRKKYKKIIYFGDGTSDFCVARKADVLYAKTRLYNYAQSLGIKAIRFEDFKNLNCFSPEEKIKN